VEETRGPVENHLKGIKGEKGVNSEELKLDLL